MVLKLALRKKRKTTLQQFPGDAPKLPASEYPCTHGADVRRHRAPNPPMFLFPRFPFRRRADSCAVDVGQTPEAEGPSPAAARPRRRCSGASGLQPRISSSREATRHMVQLGERESADGSSCAQGREDALTD